MACTAAAADYVDRRGGSLTIRHGSAAVFDASNEGEDNSSVADSSTSGWPVRQPRRSSQAMPTGLHGVIVATAYDSTIPQPCYGVATLAILNQARNYNNFIGICLHICLQRYRLASDIRRIPIKFRMIVK